MIINIDWFKLIGIFLIDPNTVLTQGTDALRIGKEPANSNGMEFKQSIDHLGKRRRIVLYLLENFWK